MVYLIIIMILTIAIIILLILYINTRKQLSVLSDMHDGLKHDYISKSVKHGQHWEQFVPFTKEFEEIAGKENFTFIGQPIDGIAFDNDSIKFIEFKTGNSTLNAKQKHVKNMVINKQVSWHEIRF